MRTIKAINQKSGKNMADQVEDVKCVFYVFI